jgi:hypothetical protein
MDGWTIGLIAILVVGVAVIAYGALSDRRRNRRAVTEMLSPPPRTIPRLPGNAPVPQYLSSVQARRPSQQRPALDDQQQQTITEQLKASDTVRVKIGYASDAFITDPSSGRTVLDDPRILVCSESIMNIRELIAVLEHMIIDHTPLVVVARAMAPEVLDTLEVNHLQRRIDLVVLLSRDPLPTEVITAATGARPIERVDLQTGYVADHDLGRCSRWISDRRSSYIIGPAQS